MNPFLESTVATSQPDARWCPVPRRSHHIARARFRSLRPNRTHGVRPAVPVRQTGLRRTGRVLRVAAFAGVLLAPGVSTAVDINAASPEQLLDVKGIGPKMARVIIEERDRGGRFESIDDLSDRVKGIGPKKAAALLASGLTVGPMAGGKAGAEAASAPAAKAATRKR